MGTNLIVLSESYPLNTNMTGFIKDGFQKSLHSCALDESSLSIGWDNELVNPLNPVVFKYMTSVCDSILHKSQF